MNPKVLVVGWDAADWQVIRPMLAQGALPTLARILQSGSSGSLATLQPCLSPVLWTSIATGKAPWRHGVLGFVEPKPDGSGLRPVGSGSRRCKALWNMVSQAGKRVHCVGWFASHPAERIQGVCVSDTFAVAPLDSVPGNWPLPSGCIHPESFRDRLQDLRWHPAENTPADLQPFLNEASAIDQTDPRQQQRITFLSRTLAQCASIHAAATGLMDQEPWDLMMVYYEAIDQLAHEFMPFHPPQLAGVDDRDFRHYQSVISGIYRFHDLMLARLLELAGEETTLILLSDHGFQSGRQRPGPVANDLQTQAAWHRDFGILVIHGPGILAGGEIHGATLTDITPTALHLLGLPTGQDMDGRVLATSLKKPEPLSTIPSWDSLGPPLAESPGEGVRDEATEITILQQFMALGYLRPTPNVFQSIRVAANELRFNEFVANREAGRSEAALAMISDLSKRNPTEPRYRLAEAEVQLNLRRREAARRSIEFLPADWRRTADLELLESRLLMAEGRSDEAMALLERAAREHPSNSRLPSQRGLYLLRQRQWREAEAIFRAALVLDPDGPFAWHGLAVAMVEQDRTREAIEAALNALDRRPQFPEAHFVLGRALVRQGDRARAIKALEIVLQQNPAHEASHSILAQLFYRTGDPHRSWLHREILRELRHRRGLQEERIRGGGKSDKSEPTAEPVAEASIESVTAPVGVALPADQEFVVVSGLPRSGTSLMMQMLRAGGLEPMTDGRRAADDDNPEGYWEWDDIQRLPSEPLILEQAHGKVVKVISALLPSLPGKHTYRIVFMKRPVAEIMASQRKMLERRGGVVPASISSAPLEELQARHAQEILDLLRRSPRVKLLEIEYPVLIADPVGEAAKVADFLAHRLRTPELMSQAVSPSLYRNRQAT